MGNRQRQYLSVTLETAEEWCVIVFLEEQKWFFFSWNILSFSGILRCCQTSRDEAERKVEPSKHQSRTPHWWGSKCRNVLGCCWVYSFWHKFPYLSQFFNVFRQWSLLTVAEYLFWEIFRGCFDNFLRLVDYFSLSLSHHLDFVLFANLIFMASTDREGFTEGLPRVMWVSPSRCQYFHTGYISQHLESKYQFLYFPLTNVAGCLIPNVVKTFCILNFRVFQSMVTSLSLRCQVCEKSPTSFICNCNCCLFDTIFTSLSDLILTIIFSKIIAF